MSASEKGIRPVLITGAEGFVAPFLARELRARGFSPILGTHYLPMDGANAAFFDETVEADVRNFGELAGIISGFAPRIAIHMAAQSSVGFSWDEPARTAAINVMGTVNLLEACRRGAEGVRVLLVGSSEEYGDKDAALAEDMDCEPNNPYAISKVAAESYGKFYAREFGLDVVMTRSFNHIGPGQDRRFAIPSFCERILSISRDAAAGGRGSIEAGNVDIRRDFSDVRDIVKGYSDIVEKGARGDVYNVGSGRSRSLREIIGAIADLVGVDCAISVNPAFVRDTDSPCVLADISKIKEELGWEPKIPLEESLADIIADMSTDP